MYTGAHYTKEGLVFGYDTGYPMISSNLDSYKFNKGEPTDNKLRLFTGGNKSLSYGSNIYLTTAQETNVSDVTAPNGQYSRFTGNSSGGNEQVFWSYSGNGNSYFGNTITFSTYLKGSGTCHLTTYDNQSGYGNSSTITLTNEWVRYSHTRSVSASATSHWSGVRGILSTTNVSIAASQMEIKGHATPFTSTSRSDTASLVDLKRTTDIDVSNVSFDSNAQMVFDGTDDYIDLGSDITISLNNQGWTAEYVFNTNSASTLQHFNSAEADDFNANWLALLSSKLAVWDHGQGTWRYGNTQFSSNAWYHIAFVQESGTSMQFYVNGEPEGGDHTTFSWSSNYSALKTRYIGRYEYNGGYSRYFTGEIPVSKYYNRALSAQEVQQNYNALKSRFE